VDCREEAVETEEEEGHKEEELEVEVEEVKTEVVEEVGTELEDKEVETELELELVEVETEEEEEVKVEFEVETEFELESAGKVAQRKSKISSPSKCSVWWTADGPRLQTSVEPLTKNSWISPLSLRCQKQRVFGCELLRSSFGRRRPWLRKRRPFSTESPSTGSVTAASMLKHVVQ
jgi:hypothetical protein